MAWLRGAIIAFALALIAWPLPRELFSHVSRTSMVPYTIADFGMLPDSKQALKARGRAYAEYLASTGRAGPDLRHEVVANAQNERVLALSLDQVLLPKPEFAQDYSRYQELLQMLANVRSMAEQQSGNAYWKWREVSLANRLNQPHDYAELLKCDHYKSPIDSPDGGLRDVAHQAGISELDAAIDWHEGIGEMHPITFEPHFEEADWEAHRDYTAALAHLASLSRAPEIDQALQERMRISSIIGEASGMRPTSQSEYSTRSDLESGFPSILVADSFPYLFFRLTFCLFAASVVLALLPLKQDGVPRELIRVLLWLIPLVAGLVGIGASTAGLSGFDGASMAPSIGAFGGLIVLSSLAGMALPAVARRAREFERDQASFIARWNVVLLGAICLGAAVLSLFLSASPIQMLAAGVCLAVLPGLYDIRTGEFRAAALMHGILFTVIAGLGLGMVWSAWAFGGTWPAIGAGAVTALLALPTALWSVKPVRIGSGIVALVGCLILGGLCLAVRLDLDRAYREREAIWLERRDRQWISQERAAGIRDRVLEMRAPDRFS